MTELHPTPRRTDLYRRLMQLAVHAQELRARCRRLRRALDHLSAQRRPSAEQELREVQGELARVDTAIANVKAALALGAAFANVKAALALGAA